MSIFNIFARLSLNTSQFEAGMKRAEGAAAGFGRTLGRYISAGAVGIGLASLGSSVTRTAVEIKNLSDQTGLTTTQVQELQSAAENTGVSLQTLTGVLEKIKRLKADALDGDGRAADLFNRLGVNANQSAYEILKQIGHAKDLSAVYELAGEKSSKLLASVRGISELGPLELISESQIERLEQADRTLNRMGRGAKVFFAGVIDRMLAPFDSAGFVARRLKNRFWPGKPATTTTAGEPDLNVGIPEPGYQSTVDSINLANQRQRELEAEEKAAKRRRIMSQLDAPLTAGPFQSSTGNDRARIGGFFVGADRTAVLDLQKQQLQKMTIMADQMKKIAQDLDELKNL